MPSAVASRYARALVEVVTRPGSEVQPQVALEQIDSFDRLLAASTDLREILVSPAIPPARKRAVIARLADGIPLAPVVKRFVFVLIDHRRTPLMHDIREAFEELLDEHIGVVRADISYALELTPPQRDAIAQALSRLTGKQIRARFQPDPALIGGVVARVGSTVYDGSVRGQLAALRQQLTGAEA
jgi:F-type H+-transporting ATPase subunit delta